MCITLLSLHRLAILSFFFSLTILIIFGQKNTTYSVYLSILKARRKYFHPSSLNQIIQQIVPVFTKEFRNFGEKKNKQVQTKHQQRA